MLIDMETSYLALAADASSAMVTPTSTLPSQTSHQPLASSTTAASPSPSPPMMSSAVPVPSPTPDRPIIPDSKYIVRRDDGMVCIRMEAEIETTVTYETAVGVCVCVVCVCVCVGGGGGGMCVQAWCLYIGVEKRLKARTCLN